MLIRGGRCDRLLALKILQSFSLDLVDDSQSGQKMEMKMKKYMVGLMFKLTTESLRNATARNTASAADKKERAALTHARDMSEVEVSNLAEENERL
ncbi:hypothetical protein CYMTET_16552 [Cymbomonas tetramitiformis]|uniref:Uncharacterized protein n=1 Tax=Cymbomonas tetramitiformis TaxID=36881 RepID=A0AAE0GBV9_9CHLO|nr:hypothetical protein CYMTET_16552 [Cymbomonas tetramitiformis]